MGPYDNEQEIHIYDASIMEAHWLTHIESGSTYIIPRESDGFEIIGECDSLIEQLNQLSDDELGNHEFMQSLGFELCPDVLRRFDESAGYYAA